MDKYFGGKTPEFERLRLGQKKKKTRVGIGNIIERMAATSTRAFGFFLLSFGAFSLFAYLFRFLFDDAFGASEMQTPLFVGFALCFLSVPFFFFDKPLYALIGDSRALSFLTYDLFSMRRTAVHTVSGYHPALSLLFGLSFAALSFFTSPVFGVLALALLLTLLCGFSAPEMPFFLSLLLFPLLSVVQEERVYLIAFLLVSFLSYLLKLFLGKRKLSVNVYDVLLLAFGIAVLASGVRNAGEVSPARTLFLFAVLATYPLFNNLLSSRRTVSYAFGAVSVSGILPAVLYLLLHILPRTGWEGAQNFSAVLGKWATGLSHPGVAAAFFPLVFFACLYFFPHKPSRLFGVVNGVSLLLSFLCILASGSRGALLGLILGLLLTAVYRYLMFALVPALLLLAAAPLTYLLPEGTALSAFFFPDGKTGLYLSNLMSLIKDRPWLGFGPDGNAVLSAYAQKFGGEIPGVFSAFAEIALEVGLPALAAFFALPIARAVHVFLTDRKFRYRMRDPGAVLATVATFSVTVAGFFENFFTSPALLFFYLILFGIGSASMRIYRGEVMDANLRNRINVSPEHAEITLMLPR